MRIDRFWNESERDAVIVGLAAVRRGWEREEDMVYAAAVLRQGKTEQFDAAVESRRRQ